jgi:hypothetical protein
MATTTRLLMTLFCVIAGILVVAGVVFSVLGLGVLPVDNRVLLRWVSAIYGAIMIGWGLTLFLLGRLAFRRKDAALMKIMLVGIAVWLVVEALWSLYLGVLFNVGVDIAVLLLFGLPMIFSIRRIEEGEGEK